MRSAGRRCPPATRPPRRAMQPEMRPPRNQKFRTHCPAANRSRPESASSPTIDEGHVGQVDHDDQHQPARRSNEHQVTDAYCHETPWAGTAPCRWRSATPGPVPRRPGRRPDRGGRRPAGRRRSGSSPWQARAVISPVSDVARAAGGHARVAGRVVRTAAGRRSRSVRWPLSTTTSPQRAANSTAACSRGSAVELLGRSSGQTRPDAASGSAGRRAGQHVRLRRQGVQGVGIDDHRLGKFPVEPADELVQSVGRPSPGPQATTVAVSASSTIRS